MADLADVLASEMLPGADLHSLLLTVLKKRVSRIAPSRLAQANVVTGACDLDGRLINSVERMGYDAASDFEAVDLSPLCPLGSVAVLTGLDQGNVLSTVRAFESASDPTVGLALECARRRKRPDCRQKPLNLCTSQRVVRFPAPTTAGFTAHFKLFCLVTAGRNAGSLVFESAALSNHIGVYLSLLKALAAAGFAFAEIAVELSDTQAVSHLCTSFSVDRDLIRSSVRARDRQSAERLLDACAASWPGSIASPLESDERARELALPDTLRSRLQSLDERVCRPLRERHPNVGFGFNMRRLTGLGYYQGPCFHITAKTESGQPFAIADGGFTDWTQTLLGDGKERLLTSAIGMELLCRLFRKQEAGSP